MTQDDSKLRAVDVPAFLVDRTTVTNAACSGGRISRAGNWGTKSAAPQRSSSQTVSGAPSRPATSRA